MRWILDIFLQKNCKKCYALLRWCDLCDMNMCRCTGTSYWKQGHSPQLSDTASTHSACQPRPPPQSAQLTCAHRCLSSRVIIQHLFTSSMCAPPLPNQSLRFQVVLSRLRSDLNATIYKRCGVNRFKMAGVENRTPCWRITVRIKFLSRLFSKPRPIPP